MAHDRFDLSKPRVWDTKLAETVQQPGAGSDVFVIASTPQKPVSVRVDQTVMEARCTRAANYPRYDWLDVANLPNRKRA